MKLQGVTIDPDESYGDKALEKLKRVGKYLGQKMVHQLLILFFTLAQKNVPGKIRRLILATLAYFVIPIDAIPDFIFGVGYTDDWAVLAASFGLVYLYSTPKTRERAASVSRFLFA